MKSKIGALLSEAIIALKNAAMLPADFAIEPSVDDTKDAAHGDFATNLALVCAKAAGRKPREIAQAIMDHLPADPLIERVEMAGPGFINFFVQRAHSLRVIHNILEQQGSYGRSNLGQGQRVQVEFVSANPTGPLHVGHGRGAAYGATIADLLEAVGYQVHREYYVNDAGRQMNILAASVWLRYLEASGQALVFPSNAYKGEYVLAIAQALYQTHGQAFVHPASAVLADLPPDEPAGGDKEIYIDAVIGRMRQLLGDAGYQQVFAAGLKSILDDIQEDLAGFGVHYQQWFSEASLSADIETAIERLQALGHLYHQDGALWFRSTAFGDDKDRVVRRDNGETTYFASDIAYHLNKFERGFDRVINVWGSDHHGYIPRVKAAVAALGLDPQRLDIRLVQFAILYRGQERVQMSTRSGSFVTLRELREDVGKDAARFFYVMRKTEQHMDFDLDLAKSQSKDNPVYYIQYAHARICSMLRKLDGDQASSATDLGPLTLPEEQQLALLLSKYPDVVQSSAQQLEPHQLTHYLRELSGIFHSYYNAHKVLTDDIPLRQARIALSQAVRWVIHNGLGLLGVDAPQEM